MLTNSEKSTIKQAASTIGVQQTRSITCPCCCTDWQEQNRPHDWRPNASMAVTRDQYCLKYHCFRATCARGSGVIPHISLDQPTRKEFKPNEYKDMLRPLSGGEKSYLHKRFEITEQQVQEQGIMFNPTRCTYIFPIRDIRGYTVGYVDRDFTGTRDLKAISYWFNDVPKLHFVLQGKIGGTCLVVEDIPSAIKAGKFVSTTALLGSHITDAQASHLSRLFSTIVLALDEDAFLKAIKLQRRYRFYFADFQLLRLTKDIKNMTYNEIEKLLEEV